MVYVQDIDGRPLMPTTRHGKVRRLLKSKKATVVNLCPFTIRLLYDTTGYKQEITLGVDTGTKHVGLSATTKSKVMFQGKERFIYARRLRGIFNIRDINGENKKDISYKKLEYVSHGLISIVAG